MYILCEQPWTQQQIGLMARKDGRYVRPIVGFGVDFRIEDMGIPRQAMPRSFNLIGRLPDIREIRQINKFFICTQSSVASVSASKAEADALLQQGQHLLLPDSPSSELWQFTNAPWWEYGFLLDEYYEYIKAPKVPRPGEPTPEEIDERLDDFEENQGKVKVVSPKKLNELRTRGVRESYIRKMRRI